MTQADRETLEAKNAAKVLARAWKWDKPSSVAIDASVPNERTRERLLGRRR